LDPHPYAAPRWAQAWDQQSVTPLSPQHRMLPERKRVASSRHWWATRAEASRVAPISPKKTTSLWLVLSQFTSSSWSSLCSNSNDTLDNWSADFFVIDAILCDSLPFNGRLPIWDERGNAVRVIARPNPQLPPQL